MDLSRRLNSSSCLIIAMTVKRVATERFKIWRFCTSTSSADLLLSTCNVSKPKMTVGHWHYKYTSKHECIYNYSSLHLLNSNVFKIQMFCSFQRKQQLLHFMRLWLKTNSWQQHLLNTGVFHCFCGASLSSFMEAFDTPLWYWGTAFRTQYTDTSLKRATCLSCDWNSHRTVTQKSNS